MVWAVRPISRNAVGTGCSDGKQGVETPLITRLWKLHVSHNHIIWYIVSYHIISSSYHIVSYHVIYHHMVSGHVVSCPVVSYHEVCMTVRNVLTESARQGKAMNNVLQLCVCVADREHNWD